MGHKANPIALRMHTNRSIDSIWYSEFKYSEFAFYDYSMRLFLQSVYSSARILPGRIISHIFAKKHNIYLFTHLNSSFNKKKKKTNKIFKRFHNYSFSKKESLFLNENIYSKLLLLHLFEAEKRKINLNQNFTNSVYLPEFPIINKEINKDKINFQNVDNLRRNYNISPLKNQMEVNASYNSGLFTQVFGIKTPYITQSALTLALMVAKGFEKKKSFRQIWSTVLEELDNLKQSENIKGLRILCAGRLGGAEMARLECRKWGSTPLHTFSERIDYAGETANTRFGKIGVKVWICYK